MRRLFDPFDDEVAMWRQNRLAVPALLARGH